MANGQAFLLSIAVDGRERGEYLNTRREIVVKCYFLLVEFVANGQAFLLSIAVEG